VSSSLVQPKRRGPNPNRLTDKQRVFIAEYLCQDEMNGTKAARAAGYRNPSVAAVRLLKHPLVCKAIGKAIYDRIQRTELTADAVLDHLRAALFLDPVEFFEPGANGYLVRDLSKIPPEIRRCIKKFKIKATENPDGTTTTQIEVETMDKDSILPLAMKHLGLVDERFKVDHGFDLSRVLPALLEQMESQDDGVVDDSVIEARIRERH
jgi:hypothetical protein